MARVTIQRTRAILVCGISFKKTNNTDVISELFSARIEIILISSYIVIKIE